MGADVTTSRVSLAQQIEAVTFAAQRQRALAAGAAVKPMRGQSVEQYDLQRLYAAVRSLEWLAQHEAEIRAWLADRKAETAP